MRPVCICGSQRYKEEVAAYAKKLKDLGVPIVFEPNFKRHRKEMIEKEEGDRVKSKAYRRNAELWALQHFDRLRQTKELGGICLVFNKEGYIGSNTQGEIGFAHALGMVIYTIEPEPDPDQGGESGRSYEPWRNAVVTEVIETPEELVKRLSYHGALGYLKGQQQIKKKIDDLRERLEGIIVRQQTPPSKEDQQ